MIIPTPANRVDSLPRNAGFICQLVIHHGTSPRIVPGATTKNTREPDNAHNLCMRSSLVARSGPLPLTRGCLFYLYAAFLDSAGFKQRHKVRDLPQPIRDGSGHCWGHTQRSMNPHEIVDEVLQRDGGRVVLQLAAEAIRQARVAPQVRANSPILTLDVAGADVADPRAIEKEPLKKMACRS
jgi:hypothetical protein